MKLEENAFPSLKIAHLIVDDFSVDVFLSIGYYLLKESLDRPFAVIEADYANLCPLPFFLIVEFGKSDVIFFSQTIS